MHCPICSRFSNREKERGERKKRKRGGGADVRVVK